MHDVHGPGAASVASELLAFLREPTRHRPDYIHGRVPLPDGHLILKFALDSFPHGWQRDMAAEDRAELREAAVAFVRQVCLWERATHYQVLCAADDAGPETLKENYRLLMALIHPDRQGDSSAWPTGCAQRANEAYAVLSDAQARAAYDHGIRIEHAAESPEPVIGVVLHPQRRGRRGGLVRTFALVSAVIAALFVVQLWWVGQVPHQYTLLERAIPIQASARWVRDVLPDVEVPRFLGGKAAFAFDPLELLKPAEKPQRLASAGNWVSVTETKAPTAVLALAAPPAVTPATPPALASAAFQAPAPAQTAPTAPARPEAPAPPVRTPVPTSSLRLAQFSAPPARAGAPVPSAAVTAEIETLVARLVSYYELGNTEGLMSLFDPDELGFWNGFRTRSTYADFFRATRTRGLRMNQLAWTMAAQTAQARGEATVSGENTDGSRLDRRVAIEIDITLRDGRARIARLSLYPDGR